jgi:hypothetical protein
VNVQTGEKESSSYLEAITIAMVKLRFVLFRSGKTNPMDVCQSGKVEDRFSDHSESGGVRSE